MRKKINDLALNLNIKFLTHNQINEITVPNVVDFFFLLTFAK